MLLEMLFHQVAPLLTGFDVYYLLSCPSYPAASLKHCKPRLCVLDTNLIPHLTHGAIVEAMAYSLSRAPPPEDVEQLTSSRLFSKL